jgi:hypothetical protein
MSDAIQDRDRPFNAEEFVELMNRGVYQGKLTEIFKSMPYEHLAKVAKLIAIQAQEKRK